MEGGELMQYLASFLVGGIICAIAQVLIDKTKLTNARILVLYVTLGVFLTAIGIYEKIVEFGKAGATVPIIGFGYTLAKGVVRGIQEKGFLGVFTGGVSATAGGIAAAIFFGYLISLVGKPKAKK